MSAPQLTLFLLLHFIIFTTPYVIPSIHSINPPRPAYTSTITSLKSLPTKKFDFINNLYPPSDVENRNGISRKDGYWRYVQANREPPLEYTYGEFELGAFMRVVDCALGYLEKKEEVRNKHGRRRFGTGYRRQPSKTFCSPRACRRMSPCLTLAPELAG